MSKTSLITVLAVIASVSAKPYIYDYRPYSYASRTAYPAAEFYPAAPLNAAYSAGYPAGYPTGPPYSAAYSSYPVYGTPLSGSYPAPLSLPTVSAYSNSYSLEDLAALYNTAPVAPVAPVAPIAPVAPVAPLTYAGYTSPYSYYYKR